MSTIEATKIRNEKLLTLMDAMEIPVKLPAAKKQSVDQSKQNRFGFHGNGLQKLPPLAEKKTTINNASPDKEASKVERKLSKKERRETKLLQ